MDLDLSGKVVPTSGTNRGIGAAIATKLAREGMHLCLIARNHDKLRKVADYLRRCTNINVQVIPAGLRDPAAPQKAIAEAVAHPGRLDLPVNNAGATKRADFITLTEEQWQDGFALKSHGYVRMTRTAWPHLRATKGSIVNIAGIRSRAGSAEFTIGGSVNAALLNFTKSMADIGIPRGVQVNAINPRLIETERFGRNIDRVMRERSLSRDDAMTFLVSSLGTTRVGHRRKSGCWRPGWRHPKPAIIQGSNIDIDGGATRSL